jgi:hypothetical protein
MRTVAWLRLVLFECGPNLALPNTMLPNKILTGPRSPLAHSYGYASAGERLTCLTRFALLYKPFMKNAG